MTKFKDAWTRYQRKRWMLPDAGRWYRTDYRRFLSPKELKAGFKPDQLRDDLGRWAATSAEEDTSDRNEGAERVYLDEYSDAARAKGHHFVARSIYRDLPLSSETKAVFDHATTGPLRAGPHGWSLEHKIYNGAVRDQLRQFMTSNGISPETMTASQARSFVDGVRQSSDPRIRDFNLGIYRRELRFLLRFGPRRLE